MTPLSGKRFLKKTANARPMVNCPMMDPTVNRTVFSRAVVKTEDRMTAM